MHDTLILAVPTIVILVGILMNRQDALALRAELRLELGSIRSEIANCRTVLSGRIHMFIGKVIELTDRVSHLEARMVSESPEPKLP